MLQKPREADKQAEPESLSFLLAGLQLLAEHFGEDLDVLLPLLYGSLQVQLPLLQRIHAVQLAEQQVPDSLHLNLQDVVLHHGVLEQRERSNQPRSNTTTPGSWVLVSLIPAPR